MEFQPVKASDKAVIDRYMKKANSRSCDMSFADIYLWSRKYKSGYTFLEGLSLSLETRDEDFS